MSLIEITENQLHSYLDCSQKYHLSKHKGVELSPPNLVAKYAIESFLSSATPDTELNLAQMHSDAIAYCSRTYDFSEIDLAPASFPAFAKLMYRLRLWQLFPISGPVDQTVNTSKLSINLHLSGLLRTERGAFRSIVFSPLIMAKDIEWNLVHRLQYEVLKDYYNAAGFIDGQSAKLYVVGFGKKGYRISTIEKNLRKDDYKKHLSVIESLIKADYHWPLMPCPYHQCPFRHMCYPK